MTAATTGSATAHKVETDFTGENVKSTGNCLCSRPGVFRDLSRQFPGINRLPAMRSQEEFAGHLGPRPRPVSRRQRSAGGKAGRHPDSREASCHFSRNGLTWLSTILNGVPRLAASW